MPTCPSKSNEQGLHSTVPSPGHSSWLLLIAMVVLPGISSAGTADLGIQENFEGITPADLNDSFIVRLQPVNYGANTSGATSVVFTITSSPGNEVVSSASGTGYSCSGTGTTSVTCTNATGIGVSTEAGPAAELTFVVDTDGTTGNVNINYSISHTDTDDVSGNNSGSMVVEIEDAGALAVCYASSDGNDDLVRYNEDGSGSPIALGDMGYADVEAISFGPDPGGPELFAYHNNRLLTLDFLGNGAGTSVGTTNDTLDVDTDQDGIAEGTDTPGDIDSMAFHPLTRELWAIERETDDDYILKVDYTTGDAVLDTFGNGVDAVEITPSICNNTPDDIDDLAISPDGTKWFVQIDEDGNDQQVGLLELNNGIPTGNLTSCYPLIDVCGDHVEDMEGTGFDQDGVLVGTTGSDSNSGSGACAGTNDDYAWSISTTPQTIGGTTGYVATRVEDLSSVGSDYEGNDCSIASLSGINRMTGTVWEDENIDGLYNPATENQYSEVTVELYQDNDNDGTVSAGDLLIQTTTADAGDGSYEFTVAAPGNFVMQVDTSTLPAGMALRTNNVEVANFTDMGNTDANNNFGYGGGSDLGIVKTASPDLVTVGQNLTYTLTVTNHGPLDTTGVTVTDTLPGRVTHVSTTPSQGSCSSPSEVTCELGGLTVGSTATVTIVVTVD